MNFDTHIPNLCRKAVTQLNVVKRLRSFIGFEQKRYLNRALFTLTSIIVHWFGIFSSRKSLQKFEKLQEHALRFLYNDHKSSYNDLLQKSGRYTMQVLRQRTLCIEIYKTMNNLNPPFMKNFFNLRSLHYSSRKPYDLKHVRPNQVTFGSNSLESVGPQIWNGLPNKMKSAENLKSFKLMIKQWNDPECNCSACCSFTFTEQ